MCFTTNDIGDAAPNRIPPWAPPPQPRNEQSLHSYTPVGPPVTYAGFGGTKPVYRNPATGMIWTPPYNPTTNTNSWDYGAYTRQSRVAPIHPEQRQPQSAPSKQPGDEEPDWVYPYAGPGGFPPPLKAGQVWESAKVSSQPAKMQSPHLLDSNSESEDDDDGWMASTSGRTIEIRHSESAAAEGSERAETFSQRMPDLAEPKKQYPAGKVWEPAKVSSQPAKEQSPHLLDSNSESEDDDDGWMASTSGRTTEMRHSESAPAEGSGRAEAFSQRMSDLAELKKKYPIHTNSVTGQPSADSVFLKSADYDPNKKVSFTPLPWVPCRVPNLY